MDLAEQLTGQHIERVVVESISDYWRPFLYLLEARGLLVWLVKACDVKQVPGGPNRSNRCMINNRGTVRDP